MEQENNSSYENSIIHHNVSIFQNLRGFQLCMALYALILSITMIVTPKMFQQPVFRVLREMHIPKVMIALILLGYSIGVMILFMTKSIEMRALIGTIGAMIWLPLGLSMILSTLNLNLENFSVSPIGVFELLGGLGCSASAIQWGKVR